MQKWNRAVRVDENAILRNLNVVNESFAQDQAIDTINPSYAFVSGWHFYAFLDIPVSREQSENPSDEMMVSRVYHYYSLSAKRVCQVFGDRAELLEHQGSLLHFHLNVGEEETSGVIAFGRLLATFVEDDVMRHMSQMKMRFTMASEYGVCCILRVPSAAEEESSYSRVSLGPCANNPAKLLLGGGHMESWELAYRGQNSGNWTKVPCRANDDSRSVIQNSLKGIIKHPEVRTFGEAYASDSIETVPDKAYYDAPRIPGYVFRADLDGFTCKVHEAFKRGDEVDAGKMAEDFIRFMEDVSVWQKSQSDDISVVTCPWAGDCCTMVMCLKNADGNPDMAMAEKVCSTFPMKQVERWEKELLPNHSVDGLGSWTYSLALGWTKMFKEDVDGTPYRLVVGWPVSVSQMGVNIDATRAGDLVMHKEDVAAMNSRVQKSFEPIEGEFVRQGKDGRKRMIDEAVSGAGQEAWKKHFHGFVVPESRPYFPGERGITW